MNQVPPAAIQDTSWDETMNEETIRLAYDEAKALRTLYTDWGDALDAKTVAVFSVASVILSVAPLFHESTPRGLALVVLIAAVICWGVAVMFCHDAYTPRGLRVDPSPHKLLSPAWLSLPPGQFYFFRLRDMAKTHNHNRDTLDDKADRLRWATAFVAAEVALLALAFMLNRR